MEVKWSRAGNCGSQRYLPSSFLRDQYSATPKLKHKIVRRIFPKMLALLAETMHRFSRGGALVSPQMSLIVRPLTRLDPGGNLPRLEVIMSRRHRGYDPRCV
jgi:hypothetical protein